MRIETIIYVEPVAKLPDIDNYVFKVYNGY